MIAEIPELDKIIFDNLIKDYRLKYIRSSKTIVDLIYANQNYNEQILRSKDISKLIFELRQLVWQEFLTDEVKFNIVFMQDLPNFLNVPNKILTNLITEDVIRQNNKQQLIQNIKHICGEYAGRVFPYIYRLALSNTQSRRSRAGKSFENIIYKLYEIFNYPYSSQAKVGRKIFADCGLGKKVDSILPNIEAFKQRRSKTIIGTMKTSLRERWQEVAEEIERTKIPVIFLLTADEDISLNKIKEMAQHNIIVVAYDFVIKSNKANNMKNIISFEDYFYSEIPNVLHFWATQ